MLSDSDLSDVPLMQSTVIIEGPVLRQDSHCITETSLQHTSQILIITFTTVVAVKRVPEDLYRDVPHNGASAQIPH